MSRDSVIGQADVLCVCAPATSAARIASIDRLRILAAIGIVWFHTEGAPGRQIAYAGLPIFLLIWFSLVASRDPLPRARDFLRRAWDRLIAPWLFWSAVYAACKLATGRPILDVRTLLVGANIHLWYLPYACVCGLVLHIIASRVLHVADHLVVSVATSLGILLLAGPASGLPVPLAQWRFGLAAIPLGLAIGRCRRMEDPESRTFSLLLVACVVLVACAPLRATSYAIATVLVCLAYVWPSVGDGFVARVAPLTFGMYLIHPLVGYALRHSIAGALDPAAHVVCVVVVSGLVTLGLMHTPLQRCV